MTTEPEQLGLIPAADELRAYERILSLHLSRLQTWTALPDERTDWALEELLDEIRVASMALRHLRGEADLPF